MSQFQTHEHDVLVIGAGGAGLRAAIEASAAGVRVALVCKSLLGKAHTVMAEGGMAAAMTVCALPRRDLQTRATLTPAAEASMAARKPAPPAPITRTSCSCV